ncbi:hypothetical protein [Microbacterium sp.]|uniref:hypothetical protein n=1 Tax=Microbacterium sp. TaxID=51671 RepID=UPI003A9132E1
MSARTISLANVDRALELLLLGRIGLHQVPVQLCSWYWAGAADARDERDWHAEQLAREVVALRGYVDDLTAVRLAGPPAPYIEPDPAAAWPRPTMEVFA